jgi:predicted O-linked N-acetylglucosamine transferase (SPINDLY family)
MLVKNRGLADEPTLERIRSEFAHNGVDASRVELRPNEPSTVDHLRLYGRVDIALDSFPYHGTTTTCEALWMGAPVITLTGQTPASRVGTSLLRTVGLSDLVAENHDQYVTLATALAQDQPRLRTLRSNLRAMLVASPLLDRKRFIRNLEGVYRQIAADFTA